MPGENHQNENLTEAFFKRYIISMWTLVMLMLYAAIAIQLGENQGIVTGIKCLVTFKKRWKSIISKYFL